MQNASTKKITISVLTILVLGIIVLIHSETANQLELKYRFYWDKNEVFSHIMASKLGLKLSPTWNLNYEQELDVVTGASRRLGDNFSGPLSTSKIDGVTGATPWEKRKAFNLASTHHNQKGASITPSIGYGTEDDYQSFSGGLNAAVDFNQRNTTLAFGYTQYRDEFKAEEKYEIENGNKIIHFGTISLTQSLSPLTLVSSALSFSKKTGYLGRPYNPVVTQSGGIRTENLPASKNEAAIALVAIQGWRLASQLGSLRLEYRNYTDSWALRSQSIETSLMQRINEEQYFRFSHRYYTQTGTVFAKEFYLGDEVYRSADVKYHPFNSHLFGVKWVSELPENWQVNSWAPDLISIGYDQVFRNTKGDPTSIDEQNRKLLYQLYSPEEMYQQGTFQIGIGFNF